MTRIRTVTACALVAALLAGGAAFAQGPRDGGRGPFGRGPGGPGMALRGLDLTEAQREQLRNVRQQHQEEVQNAVVQVRAALDAQRKAVETVPYDEGLIRSTTQALAEAQTTAAIAQARVHSDTWAVLTPAQQEQSRKLQAERETRMKERQARRAQRSNRQPRN